MSEPQIQPDSDGAAPPNGPKVPAPPPPNAHGPVSSAPSAYVGLTERSKLLVLLVAALIAGLNLVAAWHFAGKTESALALSAEDMMPFHAWVAKVDQKNLSSDARYDLGARAMTLVVSLKLVSNKQALVLTSFGGAFALLAIGFALFIIGADGAFKVIASSPDSSRVAITGTAPGLLCFLISGVLIWNGVQHKSELHAPDLRSNAASTIDAQPAPTTKPKCVSVDVFTGECN